MILTLQKLRIKNFKGIRDQEIDFHADTHIYGRNGIGKTTIQDAFSWLLWNKDSHGNAPGSDNFREKPLDENGNEVHNLATTVEAICTLDSKPFTIRRTQKEKWVKKRGDAESTYQGNASTYWLNGEEVKQQEFKDAIASIAGENEFRLIGSLSAFNQMDWKKRRQQLIDMLDKDIDNELLNTIDYIPIAEGMAEIGCKDVEVYRKHLISKSKSNTESLKANTVRIDEVSKGILPITNAEIDEAKRTIQGNNETIASIDLKNAEMRAQMESNGIQKQLAARESELNSAKSALIQEHQIKMREAKVLSDEAVHEYSRILDSIKDIDAILSTLNSESDEIEKSINDSKKEIKNLQEPIVDCTDDICPNCGQAIPSEAKEKMLQQENDARLQKLENANDNFKCATGSLVRYGVRIHENEVKRAELLENAEIAKDKMVQAKMALNQIPDAPDMASNPRIAELESEIERLRSIDESAFSALIAENEQKKSALLQEIEKCNAVLRQIDANEAAERRIKSITAESSEIEASLSEASAQLDLLSDYLYARSIAIESAINEKFKSIRWKLFDQQINGNITDCCTCMIPCSDALVAYECANTAAQINADIEIINALSDHYNVKLPVFVDNCERINELAPVQSQLIAMHVSTDKSLIVEYENDVA